MGERTRNVIVGLTAIVALLGVGVMLTLFGYAPAVLERTYTVYVEMSNAAGLYEGSRVRMNGIDIGRIAAVELQDPPTKGVLMTLKIRKGQRVPEGVVPKPEIPSIIGGTAAMKLDAVGIDLSKPTAYLPMDGTARLRGDPATLVGGIQAAATQASADIEDMVTEFKRISASFQKLSAEWTEVGRNINQLTQPRSVAEVKAGKAQENLQTIVERTGQRLEELQSAMDGINRWVNDKALQEEVRQTVASAKALAAKWTETGKKVGDAADEAKLAVGDARQKLDQFVKEYVGVADKLGKALASVQQTLDQARQGDGTVGKLLSDPALYNNVNDAAKRLQQVLTELKLILEKFKEEGLPVKL